MTTPTPTPGALSAVEQLLLLIEACRPSDCQPWLDHEKQEFAAIIDRHTARPDVDALVKALEFYAVKVGDCRKITDEGDSARRALDKDGGEVARAALARHAKGGATG